MEITMSRRPLIIDCDPGIDDAQAIMLCQGSDQFDIVGITSVSGNVSLENASRNAAYVADLLGLECPVAQGAARPLIFEMPKNSNYGSSGMGSVDMPENSRPYYSKPAWELIYEKAKENEGKLEILAIGPLTNLAIAVLKYPRLTEYVRRIVIMGGSVRAGNVTPYAEFNIYQDPFAASVVFEAGFKSIIMVGLEACETAYLTDEEARTASDFDGVAGTFLRTLIDDCRQLKERLFTDNTGDYKQRFEGRNIAYDASAAAVLIVPSIAKIEPYYVICETQSGLSYGQTIVDWNNRFNSHPNVNVTLEIDRDMFSQLFIACMGNLAEGEDEVYE